MKQEGKLNWHSRSTCTCTMLRFQLTFCLFVCLFADAKSRKYRRGNDTDETAARHFINSYYGEASKWLSEVGEIEWNYASDLTEKNKNLSVEASLRYAEFGKKVWENVTSFAWVNFTDPLLRRQFEGLSHLGSASLETDKLTEFKNLGANMTSLYSKAKICPYRNNSSLLSTTSTEEECNLALEPDLTRIMATSTNYDELQYFWASWREATGKPNRDNFLRLVEFSNNISRFDGFESTAEEWLDGYEDDEIDKEFERLWQQMKPLYLQLHAYVRRKLIHKYGEDKIKADGPLPAHLLGNMWAQTWENLYSWTAPYPDKPTIDVTDAMVKQNYTALRMFKLAEQFFVSLGLDPMPELFWEKSIIEKLPNRDMVCHASAWDFFNGKDFRIKQCTDVTMEFLETTHHEMGHIQYDLQYKDQPVTFRSGANPGFHEAIGDLMSVSVATPKHLAGLGLMETPTLDDELVVNYLYSRALKKVSFLPFAYLLDKWRWGVFRGEIKPSEMNSKWWEYRLQYQGLVPPIPRSEGDFDPASKYHVAANVEYSRYYIAAVLQLQFHKILCEVAGHDGPLYTCDLGGSKAAGQRLGEMLKLGASKPWPEALELISGGQTKRMDATPLMEYFEPLMKWLQETNKNEFIGWRD